MIDQQAFTRAADDIFYASGWFFVILIAIIWIPDRPAKFKHSGPSSKSGPNASVNPGSSAAASAAH
jgi:DHA2 family multidrug resistance protein